MSTVDCEKMIGIFSAISTKMTQERDYLCELDGAIGDADHGISMAVGFSAVSDALSELDLDSISLTDVLNEAAKSFLNAVGASTGPLYATALMRAGKWAAGRYEVQNEELPELLIAMSEGIEHRGKAKVGDKTMFDVWSPVAAAAKDNVSHEKIIEIANAAMKKTADMTAKLGRSARLGERSIGHIDPGSASAAMIISVILTERN
jgi:dihydroxyacetone kinase-like protein